MNVRKRLETMDENSRIVIGNTAVSLLVKGASLALSLLTTPALMRYFNNHAVLGVWYTMLSVLFWVLNFDLGIGNGIRNNLVKDLAGNDILSARKTVSSGFFSGALLVMVLTGAGALLIANVDLNWLFNVDEGFLSSEVLVKSTLLVFGGIMLRFYLSFVSSVFYALQMSWVNNFLALCVSVLQLLFVTCCRPANPEQGLLMLSGAYAVISNLPVCIAGIIVFSTKLRGCRPSARYIDKQYICRVMGMGSVFFICQIAYMLLMNTNEFFISRMFGPEYTTEYTFYYRLTSLISMVAMLALTPMWSVITKAMEEQRYDWVRKLYQKLKLAGAAAMVVQFAFIPLQQLVMDFWLGKGSVQVEYQTAIAFACFGSIFLYTSILSTIVCGMSRMKIQMVCYSLGVFGKLALILIFAPLVNRWSVVVWSNVLVLLPYCLVQKQDLDRFWEKY